MLDRDITQAAIDDPAIKRLLTITGVDLIVAAGLVAAVGDVHRLASAEKLVSYVGLNPRVGQSGLGLAQHGRISKQGRSHAPIPDAILQLGENAPAASRWLGRTGVRHSRCPRSGSSRKTPIVGGVAQPACR